MTKNIRCCYGSFPENDDSLYCINRITYWIRNNKNIYAKEDIQHFFYEKWDLENIPEPGIDDDDINKAIKACIIEEMVEWFNNLIELGVTKREKYIYPKWVKKIEALDSQFICWNKSPPRYAINPIFLKRNILAWKGDFQFM